MPLRISLAYGKTPLSVRLPDGSIVVEPPTAPEPPPVADLLESALRAVIHSDSLEQLAAGASRVTIVISDATRAEPRGALLDAVLNRLPASAALTVAIATGTHGPADVEALGIPPGVLARATLVNHDGHRDDDLVHLGTTARGTSVRVHRCVVDTDLVVATGGIKPHYFAGFGAGCKAIFPGLGANHEIRVNHRLKLDPRSVAGNVHDNPCRQDLEEAVSFVKAKMFLLDVVFDGLGRIQSAVAGDIRKAFKTGAQRCDPLFRVRAKGSKSIVVSDALPVTGSVYQASKLVAAVAPIADEGATIVVAAQCPFGTGDVATVNDAIYEIGVRPRLPGTHRIILVSELSEADIAPMYCEHAPTIEAALGQLDGPPTVFPRAGTCIVERV